MKPKDDMTRATEALELLATVESECGFPINLEDARQQIYGRIGQLYVDRAEGNIR